MTQLSRYQELDDKTFLICVGAMKAATSWVYANLSRTPGVAVSPLKEVQFFNARFPRNSIIKADLLAMKRLAFHVEQSGDPIDNLRSRPAFQASVDRARMVYDDNAYFAHFAHLVGSHTRVFADLTPAYAAIGEDGFRYMKEMCATQNISTKILFILRDPVDRLWSHLHLLRQFNPERDPVENWRETIRHPTTLARCDYQGTIEAIEQSFPKEDLIVLFYETLFDQGFTDLCGKMGLSRLDFDARQRENETDGKADLTETAERTFRSMLDPQYEFCRNRFGNSLPTAWRV